MCIIDTLEAGNRKSSEKNAHYNIIDYNVIIICSKRLRGALCSGRINPKRTTKKLLYHFL